MALRSVALRWQSADSANCVTASLIVFQRFSAFNFHRNNSVGVRPCSTEALLVELMLYGCYGNKTTKTHAAHIHHCLGVQRELEQGVQLELRCAA